MNSIRKFAVGLLSVCALSLIVSGCNPQETPAKTAADVAGARAEGDKNVAKERSAATARTVEAEKDAHKADAELAHQSATGEHDVAIAKAEAAHKVAIELCESRTGDALSACKKQADADFEYAKLNANATERATDPKR
ncbi:MAG: hypothetical protein NVS9B10_29150 [Nevskia sp.]